MKKPPSKTVWNKEPKKRRKKSPRKKAKDKAWAMCSKYIRLRDCLATTGTKEYGICVTCGGRFPFKKLQAGHGIPGRNDSILCDEELINCQCVGCNIWGGGRIQNTYTIFLLQKYGQDFFEEKVLLSNQDVKLDEDDWLEIYNYYKNKIDELDKNSKI